MARSHMMQHGDRWVNVCSTLSSQDMLAPCIVKYASTSFDVTSPNTTSCRVQWQILSAS